MAFDRFLSKTKESAAQAGARLKETAFTLASETTDKAAIAADKAAVVAEKAAVLAGEAWDVGRAKLRDLSVQALAELEGLRPILAECGFIIGDVQVTVPLPVEVKVSVEHTEQGKTTLEQILAEPERTLSALQRGVLQAMLHANELAVLTERHGYTFRTYDIALSTPPRVTLHLVATQT